MLTRCVIRLSERDFEGSFAFLFFILCTAAQKERKMATCAHSHLWDPAGLGYVRKAASMVSISRSFSMNDLARRIAENLVGVQQRMADAAARAGRAASDVRLVAVTKYVGPDEIAALIAAGCVDLGESRPQALWQRADSFRDPPVRWHLIGHLQRNKVARTLACASLIHSVDSERLLATIETEAAKLERAVDVLLEVNVSGDATKHGVAPEGLGGLVAAAARCRHVRTRGLMTMASREGDADAARADFARLRKLRDEIATGAFRNELGNVDLAELSMGMSGDFEQAIEEGATIVRVGSALFEGLR